VHENSAVSVGSAYATVAPAPNPASASTRATVTVLRLLGGPTRREVLRAATLAWWFRLRRVSMGPPLPPRVFPRPPTAAATRDSTSKRELMERRSRFFSPRLQGARQRRLRAITRRWISLVPS